MADPKALKVAFFDIGNTLGALDSTGQLKPFEPGSLELLSVMKGVLGLRVGIITNLPATMSHDDIKKLLESAGILRFVDKDGLITNHDAGADKPDPVIYHFAADQLAVPIEQCLYIGESTVEVAGALDAGMKAILKPFPAQPPA
jgi:FMN phosphatase YigB (HAD superfamily)